MTVRKNQAALTPEEKRAFTSALLELKRNGSYDRFVTTHNGFIMSDTDSGNRVGHRSPPSCRGTGASSWSSRRRSRKWTPAWRSRTGTGPWTGPLAPPCSPPTSSAAPGGPATGRSWTDRSRTRRAGGT